MCTTVSSVGDFFLERECAHFNFILFYSIMQNPKLPPLPPFFLHHPVSRASSLSSFSFRNITFQTGHTSLSSVLIHKDSFSGFSHLTVNLLFLRIIYLSPFVLSCAAFFQSLCRVSAKGLW